MVSNFFAILNHGSQLSDIGKSNLSCIIMQSFLHRHPNIGAKGQRRSLFSCCGSDSVSPSLKAKPLKPSRVSSSFLASLGLFAIGAFSIGALAIGAVAIGRLALGKLVIGKGRIDKLEIGELHVAHCECGENKGTEEPCCQK
jgi:hypothetical protein